MSFESIALVVLLVAQIYRIARSEYLLRQERSLHGKIEQHLSSLTPVGMWPQYEALKNFHGDAVAKIGELTSQLEAANSKSREAESESPKSEEFRLLRESQSYVSESLQLAIGKLEELESQSAAVLQVEEMRKKVGRLEQQFKRRVAPRGFDSSPDYDRLCVILATGPKGKVEIQFQPEDTEAYFFAHTLKMTLRMCQWEVSEPVPFPPSNDGQPSAIAAGATDSDLTILAGVLESDWMDRIPTTQYAALCSGLHAAGIGLHCRAWRGLAPGVFRLLVGPKR